MNRGDVDMMAARKAMKTESDLERALWKLILWKIAFWISLIVNLILITPEMT